MNRIFSCKKWRRETQNTATLIMVINNGSKHQPLCNSNSIDISSRIKKNFRPDDL